jgi:two-component system response regulator DesR
MMTYRDKVGVLCVDDNAHVADALRIKFGRDERFDWKGWLPSADELVEVAIRECPAVVLLDVDMPGKDPFDATAGLVERCPESRVLFFSGHVRPELIDRAIEAGAWGYVSKSDGEGALMDAACRVAAGEFVLGSEVRAAYNRG